MNFVKVRAFSGATASLDAQLAKGILTERGIPSVVPNRFGAEVLPGVDLVQLLVPEDDADEAAQILQDFLDPASAAGR
ncbi:MAG TPA: DUF2007 domain-containing protein [Terriglobia bacterium]|nr:DUF2007 domain-containing protein [Terriglobia bacterium]